MKPFLQLVILVAVVLGGIFVLGGSSDLSVTRDTLIPSLKNEPSSEPLTFVMTGDVMLGRNVRHLMQINGEGFPFTHVEPIFADADAVVVNLEGPITSLDAPDPRVSPEQPYPMRFAFDPVVANTLASAGITHVSLANNHAGDQGQQGRKDTRTSLEESNIKYFGETRTINPETHLRFAGHDVAFIGVDVTVAPLDIRSIKEEIGRVGTTTHVIAFMHWGDEYQLVHNATQESIAHALIDAGVDAVVGSHPHVVQDIEVYNGAPIFYSLGNFIFDQYWNADVESGLALRITHDDGGERYELIPIDGNHSQPKLMEEPERQAFLDALAGRSQAELGEGIRSGVIDL